MYKRHKKLLAKTYWEGKKLKVLKRYSKRERKAIKDQFYSQGLAFLMLSNPTMITKHLKAIWGMTDLDFIKDNPIRPLGYPRKTFTWNIQGADNETKT